MSVCLSVCKFLGKLQTLGAQRSYWQTSNYTRNKNNKRLLLKPFDYKVMTIYITHGYCLHTSKHKCYCIMTITSKALHQIKHNWSSPGCNLEHWLQVRKLLSSSTYFKSCVVHVIRTCVNIFQGPLFVECFTEDLSFFF